MVSCNEGNDEDEEDAMVLMLFDKRDMVALSLPTNNDRLIIDCRFCC